MTRVAEHRDQHIPHPPPRIEYGAGSDLPLARGAKRLRSAKGEEGGTSPPINPFLQGEKVLDRVAGGRRIVFDDDYDYRCPREDYLP